MAFPSPSRSENTRLGADIGGGGVGEGNGYGEPKKCCILTEKITINVELLGDTLKKEKVFEGGRHKRKMCIDIKSSGSYKVSKECKLESENTFDPPGGLPGDEIQLPCEGGFSYAYYIISSPKPPPPIEIGGRSTPLPDFGMAGRLAFWAAGMQLPTPSRDGNYHIHYHITRITGCGPCGKSGASTGECDCSETTRFDKKTKRICVDTDECDDGGWEKKVKQSGILQATAATAGNAVTCDDECDPDPNAGPPTIPNNPIPNIGEIVIPDVSLGDVPGLAQLAGLTTLQSIGASFIRTSKLRRSLYPPIDLCD